MTGKWAAALALCLVALGVSGVALVGRDAPVGGSAAVPMAVDTAGPARPRLALLTSLPLLFGEKFALDSPPTAAALRLDAAYALSPIAVTDVASLRGHRLLLMAHPRAQPAEMLVALDRWVRAGGRVVLLADPRLDWHSERPFGDPLRPPPDFADTGLLAHWGLSLEGPVVDGPQSRHAAGLEVLTASPGSLAATNDSCAVSAGGLLAECRVGRGVAMVVADADFLNVSGEGALDGPTSQNLDLLMRVLSRGRNR